MLSWRLWQSIADTDINDPIFRRVSQIQTPAARPFPQLKTPWPVWLFAAIVALVSLFLAPQILVIALVAPVIMITLVVATPVLLPAFVWLAGAFSTGEILHGIYQEKHQYTYDLICASTNGKLHATWSFATGMLHQGGWLAPLRWGTRATLRFGIAALAGLTLLTLLVTVFNSAVFSMDQVRLVLLPMLMMVVYCTNLTQTFVVSHIIGLLASSFDLAKRDAMLVGLVGYTLLNTLPLVGAAFLYFPFRWFVFEPHPLALMAVEAGALLLIVAGRELTIITLWSALKRRMNSRLSKIDRGHTLRRDAAWGVT